jgi:hypothetical protein
VNQVVLIFHNVNVKKDKRRTYYANYVLWSCEKCSTKCLYNLLWTAVGTGYSGYTKEEVGKKWSSTLEIEGRPENIYNVDCYQHKVVRKLIWAGF